jgi:hypothetical protein
MSLPEQLQQSDRLDALVWKITSVAVIGSFLSQLDATVVNVSLTTLAVELHSSLTAIQWVTSGYSRSAPGDAGASLPYLKT